MRKGLKAYQANYVPYLFSFFTILIVFAAIILFGIGMILYNSENILNSDEFVNLMSTSDFAAMMLALITPVNILIFLTFLVLSILISAYLSAGIYGVCLEGSRGRAHIKTFFGTILRRGGSYLLASLLIFVLWALLLVALIFPVALVASLLNTFSVALFEVYLISMAILVLILTPFVLFVPISVVWGKGISDSFKQSFNLGREYYFEILAFLALIGAINTALGIIPLLGSLLQIFLIYPIMFFTLCSYYLDKTSAKKPFEVKPAPKIQEAPSKRLPARAKKVRIIETKSGPVREELFKEESKPEIILPEPSKIPADKIKPDLMKPLPKRRGRKKASVYIVASKTPIRMSRGSKRGYKNLPSRKYSRKKTTRGRKKKGSV